MFVSGPISYGWNHIVIIILTRMTIIMMVMVVITANMY